MVAFFATTPTLFPFSFFNIFLGGRGIHRKKANISTTQVLDSSKTVDAGIVMIQFST